MDKSKLRNFALMNSGCRWRMPVRTNRDWIDTLGPPWNAKPRIAGMLRLKEKWPSARKKNIYTPKIRDNSCRLTVRNSCKNLRDGKPRTSLFGTMLMLIKLISSTCATTSTERSKSLIEVYLSRFPRRRRWRELREIVSYYLTTISFFTKNLKA